MGLGAPPPRTHTHTHTTPLHPPPFLQLNLAAIKQAEEQDRAQLLKEREDTKAARDAASLKAWQQKHGVQPKGPKKPRAPRPKREPAAQAAAAAGAAGARGGVAAAAAAVLLLQL